jgi:hypothetical protein
VDGGASDLSGLSVSEVILLIIRNELMLVCKGDPVDLNSASDADLLRVRVTAFLGRWQVSTSIFLAICYTLKKKKEQYTLAEDGRFIKRN